MTEEIVQSLRRSAAFWGAEAASLESLSTLPLLTQERLRERMKQEPIRIERRYAPSSFNTREDFSLVPAYRRDVWPQMQRVLDETGAHALLTFLPAILQLDIPVFTTLQSRGLPGASIASNNTRVAVEAIRQLRAEGVVATSESARQLEQALFEPAAPKLSFWYILLPSGAPLHRAREGTVYHDLQLMPGVSLASQCAALAQEGTPHFHPSADYVWERVDGDLIVTSIDERPAPLLRMRACRGTLQERSCGCGASRLLTYEN